MKLLISLLTGAAMAAGVQSPAAPAPQSPLPETSAPVEVRPLREAFDARAALTRANASLNAVRTAEGRFTQIAPDGAVSQGRFWLQRPGRMRFEYDPPTPLLIVADGTTVAIEDRELETFDRAPIASTPLGLILKSDIDLQADADIAHVGQSDGHTVISVTDPTGEADGVLTLIFAPGTDALVEWRVSDATGAVTQVLLDDVKTGGRIPARLFILEEEDDPTERRR